MNKPMHIFDQHAFVGASGTALSIVLQNINMAISIAVGLFTLGYMILKFAQELKKMTGDKK